MLMIISTEMRLQALQLPSRLTTTDEGIQYIAGLPWPLPNKQKILTLCWFNVGSPFVTLAQQ